jgi:hypothetical protein
MNMEGKSNLLTLYSNPLIVKNIVKKTKAMGWKDIEVDDQIIIKLELNKKYYGRGGWVPYYTIVVPDKIQFEDTHNNMINRLMNFELESYNPDNRGILNLF